jgi:hypothetical protein
MESNKVILIDRKECKNLLDEAFNKNVFLGTQITARLVSVIDGVNALEHISDVQDMIQIFDFKSEPFRESMFHAN